MRVVVYSDAPVVATGFATVIRNVFGALFDMGALKPEDVAFFGINYTGDYHPQSHIFRQWPAKVGMSFDPDPYGKQRFTQMMLQGFWPCDVLFVVQDHFTVAPFLPNLIQQMRAQIPQGRTPFKVIQYIPVDGDTLKPQWTSWMPELVDYPVAYMHWSAKALLGMVPALQGKLRTIYHGTNPETFFPIPTEERQAFRRQTMGVADEQPLLLWVNRNQPRKDGPRALQIFRRVLDRHPNAVLYMHCNAQDSMGFDLNEIRQQLRLPEGTVRFPMNFSEGTGVTLADLNRIYNAGDVGYVTARGEGFGLTTTEAMCTGLPLVAPKHTSFAELLADDRGVLVPPLPDQQIIIGDNDQLRPVCDVEAMAAKLCWAIEHPEHAKGLGRRGMAWAKTLSWREVIAPQWAALFAEAEASLKPEPPAAPPYAFRAEALPA